MTVNFIVRAVCKGKELVNTSKHQEWCTAVLAVLQPCTLISIYYLLLMCLDGTLIHKAWTYISQYHIYRTVYRAEVL